MREQAEAHRFIPEPLIEIGYIVKAWGVHGHIKVAPSGSSPRRFLELSDVWIVVRSENKGRFFVEDVRVQADGIRLKLETIDSRETAAGLRGGYVCVPETDAVSCGEWEFFHHQLIGLKVYSISGEYIGTLDSVWEVPANDVYRVVTPAGEEILIPAVRSVIREVDIDAGKLIIDPLEGMLDATTGQEKNSF